ncbi:MAG TPA: SDR family NAD(P)-dependent oxidoreductase [Acidimicrobiia bacterium]|jgi:NAD(P)-dependent dehydrogenase (short-subunit alcohol dehydrogenase family)
MDVSGTVAVVTGGASGIGRATAAELARRGARGVVLADLNDTRLAEADEEISALGARVLTVHCDVARDEDVDSLRDAALAEFGDVDIVMNNAGVVILGPADLMTMEEWDWILQINLYGVIRGVRAFVPHLRAKGRGWVVNTASVAGLFAYAWDTPAYITAKFGVVGLTEALALYLRPLGVGVSLLCPGLVSSNMGDTARMGGPDPAAWLQQMPLSDPVEPSVAGTAVADAIRDERFLVLTHPEEARERMGRRGADIDAFVAAQIERLPTPPNLPG